MQWFFCATHCHYPTYNLNRSTHPPQRVCACICAQRHRLLVCSQVFRLCSPLSLLERCAIIAHLSEHNTWYFTFVASIWLYSSPFHSKICCSFIHVSLCTRILCIILFAILPVPFIRSFIHSIHSSDSTIISILNSYVCVCACCLRQQIFLFLFRCRLTANLFDYLA